MATSPLHLRRAAAAPRLIRRGSTGATIVFAGAILLAFVGLAFGAGYLVGKILL